MGESGVVFTPNQHCVFLIPGKLGSGYTSEHSDESEARTSLARCVPMTWAQRLKWVFNNNFDVCAQCSGHHQSACQSRKLGDH